MANSASVIEQKSFQENLIGLRIKRGLTQKQMSDLLGVAYASYNQWENGIRLPRMQKIRGIAEKLGVSASFLIGSSNPEIELNALNSLPFVDNGMFVGEDTLTNVLVKGLRYNPIVNISIDYFAFNMRDHSMTKPSGRSINSGMVVICSKVFSIEELRNSISCPACVSVNNGEGQIREINFDGSKVILTPWNPSYEELIVPQEKVTIWGKVIKTMQDF